MPTTPLAKAIYTEIGARVAEARHRASLSQEALGAAIGVTRTSISNLEKGRQNIPLVQLYRLARVLGKPVSDLLPHREAVEAAVPQTDVTISGAVRPMSQQRLQKTLLSVMAGGNPTAGGSDA